MGIRRRGRPAIFEDINLLANTGNGTVMTDRRGGR